MEERNDLMPDPGDLESFLPWFCTQMALDFYVVIKKTLQEGYISLVASDRTSKVRAGKSRAKLPSSSLLDTPEKGTDDVEDEPSSSLSQDNSRKTKVNVTLVLDNQGTVVGMKFEKNKTVPRQMIQILILIIEHHWNLSSITINGGLHAFVLYELTKMLIISRITDICLDGCYVKEGNYYLLLEKPNCLKNLSLSRCSIDDVVLGLIASQLAYPQPGATTLVSLNLSTNKITDTGAKSLGNSLRSNEKLAYLNLADNMISDEGLDHILNSFLEFLLTDEEVIASRQRHMVYIKEMNLTIKDIMKELKKPKPVTSTPTSAVKKTKIMDDISTKSLGSESYAFDSYRYERAATMAFTELGSFKDPFRRENIVSKGSRVYCFGNKTLCYLNLAYNNLSFNSVRKLLKVVVHQKNLDRRPVGLLNMCLDGNLLPAQCQEMWELSSLLELGLASTSRRSGTVSQMGMKKKPSKPR